MVENQQQQAPDITYDEMSKFVRRREHLHEALGRDGWKLPSKHAAICTTEWMLRVRNQEIFCVRSADVQNGSPVCFTPPPRKMLQEKLERIVVELEAGNHLNADSIPKIHKLIGSLRLRSANVEWYVLLIGYFNPNDEIFRKDYKYVRQHVVPLEPTIGNNDGLFNSLPPLSEKEMRSTNRMRMPKELNLQVKMAKLDRRQQQMIEYRQDLEQKMQLNQEHQNKVEQELNDAIFAFKE